MRLEGIKARYSPWTGMQAGNVERPSTMGTMMQYGATGAAMGQNMQRQQDQKQFMESYKNQNDGREWKSLDPAKQAGPRPGEAVAPTTPSSPQDLEFRQKYGMNQAPAVDYTSWRGMRRYPGQGVA